MHLLQLNQRQSAMLTHYCRFIREILEIIRKYQMLIFMIQEPQPLQWEDVIC